MKFTSSQPSRVHCNSTIIYFYQREQNLTQFVKVLLVKLSEMLHSSNFVRLSTVKVLRYTVSKILCFHSQVLQMDYLYDSRPIIDLLYHTIASAWKRFRTLLPMSRYYVIGHPHT